MRKLILVLSALALLVAVSPTNLFAADASIIKIYNAGGGKGELVLDPPSLYVTGNTVVIWMNGVEGVEVQVVFDDGKACQDVTVSPRQLGFSLNKTCYVTSFIPYAATSSLKFNEPGTFKYVVSTQDGKAMAKGTIHVRDL